MVFKGKVHEEVYIAGELNYNRNGVPCRQSFFFVS